MVPPNHGALSLCGADAAALQAAGREAEAAMFRATGGVNTHKGALYSFSVLLAALGRCLTEGGDVFAHAAALAAELHRLKVPTVRRWRYVIMWAEHARKRC